MLIMMFDLYSTIFNWVVLGCFNIVIIMLQSSSHLNSLREEGYNACCHYRHISSLLRVRHIPSHHVLSGILFLAE